MDTAHGEQAENLCFSVLNIPCLGVRFGLGVLPAAKDFLKNGFLKQYLTKMYVANHHTLYHEPFVPWTAVAHAITDEVGEWVGGVHSRTARPCSNIHTFTTMQAMNTMNIAMPDLSAEYWCTFVPPGEA